MAYIVIGQGVAGSWSKDASAVEPQDKDLRDRARERGLFEDGHKAGACDRDENLLGEGWLLVVGEVNESDLNSDPSVIAHCTVAEKTPSKIEITLSSANMGQVDEVDFDLWARYVAENIDDAMGFEVESVDQLAFGEAGDDVVAGGTEEQRQAILSWLGHEGWDAFCGDTWETMRKEHDAPATTAATCAKTLLEQGWDGTATYNLGAFHGDTEALRDALGREPTQEERVAFEAAVRAALVAEQDVRKGDQIRSLSIREAAGERGARVVWERGEGDRRLVGWELTDGRRAIETNGDAVWDGDDGFREAWESRSLDAEAQ
jgi:hypothetical protein